MTSLALVIGPIRNAVGFDVALRESNYQQLTFILRRSVGFREQRVAYLVSTRMHIQRCSERCPTRKPKQHVQRIRRKHEEWRYGEGFVYGTSDEVEEGEHGEDGDEDYVVYYGRVAGFGFRDHVACERHYEEGEEEL